MDPWSIVGLAAAVFVLKGLLTPARFASSGGLEMDLSSDTFQFRTSRTEQTKAALRPDIVYESPNMLWLNGSRRISGVGFDIPLTHEHHEIDAPITPSEAIRLYRMSTCCSQTLPVYSLQGLDRFL